MFAQELHVRPWEIGRLTVDQFNGAITAFDQQLEEQRKAAAEAQR